MAKGGCNASANYFVLFVLLLFFMLIYASFLRLPSKEYYANELLDPKETQFMQGINIPLKYEPTWTDISDPVKPPVDGTPDAPRSMHMFSFNRCAPECCIDSPYSCDRGCVCMTDKQYDYLDGRGKNHSKNACTFEDSGF
jgi:hypothetical protein